MNPTQTPRKTGKVFYRNPINPPPANSLTLVTPSLSNAPQRITVIDLQKKRRSCTNDEGKGSHAFLGKSTPVPSDNGKKTFFRTSNQQAVCQFSQLCSQIVSSPPPIQLKLAVCLGLIPPNVNRLYSYLQSITPTDMDTINNIKMVFNDVMNGNSTSKPFLRISRPEVPTKENIHKTIKLGPMSSYDYFDFRFVHSEMEEHLFKAPILIGLQNFNLSFQIPDLGPDYRVLMQSFLAQTAPPSLQWPQSLCLYSNKIIIKGPGFFTYPFIDLTDFGHHADITITCGKELKPFALLIRAAQIRTFKQMLEIIMSSGNQDTHFNKQEAYLICPISGKLMKYPGKGKNCRHAQCFDLIKYMKFCTQFRKWSCPICHQDTPFYDLIFSKPTMDLIKLAAVPSPKVQTNFSSQDSPLVDFQVPSVENFSARPEIIDNPFAIQNDSIPYSDQEEINFDQMFFDNDCL